MNHLVKPSSDKEELQRATSHGGDGASGTCCHGGDRGLGGGGEWQRNSGQCSTPSSLCVSAVGTGGSTRGRSYRQWSGSGGFTYRVIIEESCCCFAGTEL